MKRTGLLLLVLTLSSLAISNDADVSFGGSPKLLRGKTKVRMLRESIVMSVGRKTTKVVCDFWFRNDGPTATLRVGFPDDGNANEEIDTTHKVVSNFTYFKSWVNGKSVPTGLSMGDDSVTWHTKTVRFPKGATIHVRDEYSMITGYAIATAGGAEGTCKWARYIVHTGASWNGNIGETKIVVTFGKDLRLSNVNPVDCKTVTAGESGRSLKSLPWPSRGTAIWEGPAAPTSNGNQLTFLRRNWKPSDKDDLDIWFAFNDQ